MSITENSSTQTERARKATIVLAGKDIDCYQLPSGEYRYAANNAARAVGKGHTSFTRFLGMIKNARKSGVQSLKPLPSNDRRDDQSLIPIEGNRPMIGATSEEVVYYWGEEAEKGNQEALALVIACAHEALTRRADHAFSAIKSQPEYETQAKLVSEKWLKGRDFLRLAHGAFQNSCLASGFNAAHAHDALTKAFVGLTAKETKDIKALVCGDAAVALNYHEDPETLQLLTAAKLKFASLKSGTLQERIDRTMDYLTKYGA